MNSMAHGRNIAGWPAKTERRPKKLRSFRSVTPDGRRVKKQFRDQPVIEKPLALYYELNGSWVWHAVCDSENKPDWAKNYTQVPASLVLT